jgi:hypothetical protein
MSAIIVSSVIANKPLNGGNAWVVASWVRGLQRLGFTVYFVEQIGRDGCVGAAGGPASFEESLNLAYFRRVMDAFGLARTAALVYDGGERTDGLTYRELVDVAGEASLLINVTGHLTLKPVMAAIRRKAYLDLDPGFTQLWHADGHPGARLEGHDVYFTIGENIGTPGCPIPTSSIPWRTTRQPVVLDDWPVCEARGPERFTSVTSWRGPYGRVTHAGRTFGLKAHEFRRVIELPQRAPHTFELAVAIEPADEPDLMRLRQHGWRIVDPRQVAAEPATFRQYVQESSAEFCVAQGVYADTGSGWFSDRTVRYLASGKPVLVQDTGFGRTYPVGEGLVAFRTVDDAVAGAARIARDYAMHCRAARALAEEYFDSTRVLRAFLEHAGAQP